MLQVKPLVTNVCFCWHHAGFVTFYCSGTDNTCWPVLRHCHFSVWGSFRDSCLQIQYRYRYTRYNQPSKFIAVQKFRIPFTQPEAFCCLGSMTAIPFLSLEFGRSYPAKCSHILVTSNFTTQPCVHFCCAQTCSLSRQRILLLVCWQHLPVSLTVEVSAQAIAAK